MTLPSEWTQFLNRLQANFTYLVNHSSGGGGVTDVEVNNNSVVSGGVANIVTNTAYNSSTNKIATMNDVFSRNIGEIVQSTIPLTDAGLHLLDGSEIVNMGIYSNFFTKIQQLYNSGNYDYLFTTASDWQTSVDTYGVCGKFVYSAGLQTLKLPKITGFAESTIDVTTLGDLTEAGLPNITGAFNASQLHDGSPVATGAFGTGGAAKKSTPTSDTDSSQYGFNLDASRSSAIYGNSSTVQPQSIKVLYYIVVANSTKTEIEVDIDNVVTDLNSKLDKNLSNIPASSKELITGWCVPDYENAITIANNTNLNTAEDNGFIILNFFLTSAGSAYLQINGVNVAVSYRGSSYVSPCSGVFPVLKGDTFKITSTNHRTYGIYMFAPAKGIE